MRNLSEIRSPSPPPRAGAGMKRERELCSPSLSPPTGILKRELDSDSDDDEPTSSAKRTKTSKTNKTGADMTAKKPGRKPGVAYASKKWTGAELEALFFAGLAGTANGTVPATRFQDAVDGRSVGQCANAWR